VCLINRGHREQLGNLEADLQCLIVDPSGRLVVFLDKTGAIVGEILKFAVDTALLDGRLVKLAQLAPSRVEPASEPSGHLRWVTQRRRAGTEQLCFGVELLVDLKPGNKSEPVVIVLVCLGVCIERAAVGASLGGSVRVGAAHYLC
jgi:hypothetical protein